MGFYRKINDKIPLQGKINNLFIFLDEDTLLFHANPDKKSYTCKFSLVNGFKGEEYVTSGIIPRSDGDNVEFMKKTMKIGETWSSAEMIHAFFEVSEVSEVSEKPE